MISVHPVPVAYADRIWPWVAGWVEQAIRRNPEDGWTLENAKRAIAKGHVATWVAIAPKKSHGILLAEWSEAEARIVLLAGDRILTLVHNVEQVEQWARSLGCRALIIPGRRGWRRVLRNRGYKPAGAELRKDL